MYSVKDSVCVCHFVFGASFQLFDTNQLLEGIQAVTGWDIDMEELLRVGERRVNLLQVFNAREGFSPADDQLPKKFFQALQGGASDGQHMIENEIETAKSIYYQKAGWDPNTAHPTKEKLTSLELEWAADYLVGD
jgi:aldehyde:ferredoxin oxidoreductase